ncbi:MAG: AzlC family ABC transporter permease [Desulfotalea sp.]
MSQTCKNVINGIKIATPVVLGYLPIGFAYGVLAEKSGLSATNTILMSIIVFAGSAQFIAVGLFASGTSPAAVILTTFIVNLRHTLMAVSLAPYLSRWNKYWQAFFAYELTDETFALHSARLKEMNNTCLETLSVNMTAQFSWVIGTVLGVFAADLISDIKPFGLDYALSAMFIGLLVGQCIGWIKTFVACLAGGVATVLYMAGWQQSYVIVATIFSASVGLGIELWIKQKS